MKCISARDNLNLTAVRCLITEVLTLSRLEHPFVVSMLGYCFEPCICLVMELVPGGNLADLLSCESVPLLWTSLLTLAMQVGSALQFLHGQRPSAIVHTDVKARNILLVDAGSCKLADFGLARVWSRNMHPALRAHGIVAGSGRYIAPEVLRGQAISPAADIWSFGVTMWEMSLRRRFPSRDAYVVVPSGGHSTHVPRWKRTLDKYARHVTNPPQELKRVIALCLSVDPRKRPTSDEVFFEFLYLADDASRGSSNTAELPLAVVKDEADAGDDG